MAHPGEGCMSQRLQLSCRQQAVTASLVWRSGHSWKIQLAGTKEVERPKEGREETDGDRQRTRKVLARGCNTELGYFPGAWEKTKGLSGWKQHHQGRELTPEREKEDCRAEEPAQSHSHIPRGWEKTLEDELTPYTLCLCLFADFMAYLYGVSCEARVLRKVKNCAELTLTYCKGLLGILIYCRRVFCLCFEHCNFWEWTLCR